MQGRLFLFLVHNKKERTMDRELLEKPFTPDQIKQRDGSFGNTLDYIEGHSVIQRLNEAFDSKWSFEVVKHEVQLEIGEVIVLGKLSADGVHKFQFGSSTITKAKESGEIISLADDLKAAATDAIKKCASLLGVGLHLYQYDTSKSCVSPKTHQPQQNSKQIHVRISSKQHKFLLQLAKDNSMTRQELNDHCKSLYNVVLDHLSRNNASALIESMLADQSKTA